MRKTCSLFSCATRERKTMEIDNVDLCYKNFTIRITQRTVTERGKGWCGPLVSQEVSILKGERIIEAWDVSNARNFQTDSLIDIIKKAKQYIDGIYAWRREDKV